MDSRELERVKQFIIRRVRQAHDLYSDFLPEDGFIMATIMHNLENGLSEPDQYLLGELGEEGFAIFRNTILLCSALNLKVESIRQVAGAVKEALETPVPDLPSILTEEGVKAHLEHWSNRGKSLTAALGLPKEQKFNVFKIAHNIDPRLVGFTKLGKQDS